MNLSREDILIGKGAAELKARAKADIMEAHGEPAERLHINPETLALYPRIVEAVEIDRDVNA